MMGGVDEGSSSDWAVEVHLKQTVGKHGSSRGLKFPVHL